MRNKNENRRFYDFSFSIQSLQVRILTLHFCETLRFLTCSNRKRLCCRVRKKELAKSIILLIDVQILWSLWKNKTVTILSAHVWISFGSEKRVSLLKLDEAWRRIRRFQKQTWLTILMRKKLFQKVQVFPRAFEETVCNASNFSFLWKWSANMLVSFSKNNSYKFWNTCMYKEHQSNIKRNDNRRVSIKWYPKIKLGFQA